MAQDRKRDRHARKRHLVDLHDDDWATLAAAANHHGVSRARLLEWCTLYLVGKRDTHPERPPAS